RRPKKADVHLQEFTLFFTTQIGPHNLSDDYRARLEGRLHANIAADDQLRELLTQRVGTDDIERLCTEQFDTFFKLAMPKVIAQALMEADWYIQPEPGIVIYEFERDSTDGPYRMLHLGMHISRKQPPVDRRAPGEESVQAADAYRAVVRHVFTGPEEMITLE